jgi:hypothetical protein
MITQEEKNQLKALASYPEYPVFLKVIKAVMDDLKDVTRISESDDIAAQALGKKYAHEALEKVLGDLGLYMAEKTTKSNTYE